MSFLQPSPLFCSAFLYIKYEDGRCSSCEVETEVVMQNPSSYRIVSQQDGKGV